MLLCSPTVKGSSKVAGQVSKVVASEQGCGEYKVVGAYPNCTWCIHPLHMVYTPTAHVWGSMAVNSPLDGKPPANRYLCSHGTLKSPIKWTPRMQDLEVVYIPGKLIKFGSVWTSFVHICEQHCTLGNPIRLFRPFLKRNTHSCKDLSLFTKFQWVLWSPRVRWEKAPVWYLLLFFFSKRCSWNGLLGLAALSLQSKQEPHGSTSRLNTLWKTSHFIMTRNNLAGFPFLGKWDVPRTVVTSDFNPSCRSPNNEKSTVSNLLSLSSNSNTTPHPTHST